MELDQSVTQMRDEQVLARFGTSTDPASRGFDEATHAQVWAYEYVLARSRVAHYRALYSAFIEGGKHYMIENLDERSTATSVPAKLIFTDDPADLFAVDESAEVVAWTEHTLLSELTEQRAILDFFAGVLDEFQPAVAP
jgi:hypothetical protein